MISNASYPFVRYALAIPIEKERTKLTVLKVPSTIHAASISDFVYIVLSDMIYLLNHFLLECFRKAAECLENGQFGRSKCGT
jgi:hypothetical protein